MAEQVRACFPKLAPESGELRLYTKQQVASRLSCSLTTIKEEIRAGRLRYTHRVRGHKRISHAELVRFLETLELPGGERRDG